MRTVAELNNERVRRLREKYAKMSDDEKMKFRERLLQMVLGTDLDPDPDPDPDSLHDLQSPPVAEDGERDLSDDSFQAAIEERERQYGEADASLRATSLPNIFFR